MKRPSEGAHVRKPKPVSRADLRRAYEALFMADAIGAGMVVLDYYLSRVQAELGRDGAPAGGDGRGTEELSAEL